ncbi:unnamed protein product [Cunninghamella blakesleeana]
MNTVWDFNLQNTVNLLVNSQPINGIITVEHAFSRVYYLHLQSRVLPRNDILENIATGLQQIPNTPYRQCRTATCRYVSTVVEMRRHLINNPDHQVVVNVSVVNLGQRSVANPKIPYHIQFQNQLVNGMWECAQPGCDNHYASLYTMLRHYYSHFGEEVSNRHYPRFSCTEIECVERNNTFSYRRNLYRHYTNVHNVSNLK